MQNNTDKNIIGGGHTSGPWKLGIDTGYRHIIHAPGSFAIAQVLRAGECTPQEIEANARLVAAAPELLCACRHVLRILEGPKPNKPGGASRDILRDAIAKATA